MVVGFKGIPQKGHIVRSFIRVDVGQMPYQLNDGSETYIRRSSPIADFIQSRLMARSMIKWGPCGCQCLSLGRLGLLDMWTFLC